MRVLFKPPTVPDRRQMAHHDFGIQMDFGVELPDVVVDGGDHDSDCSEGVRNFDPAFVDAVVQRFALGDYFALHKVFQVFLDFVAQRFDRFFGGQGFQDDYDVGYVVARYHRSLLEGSYLADLFQLLIEKNRK